ncbi:MAG: hypothetical protein ACR2FY_02725 [Pirellulaceae bacterium]
MTEGEAVALVQSFADSRKYRLGPLIHAKLKSQHDPESWPDDVRDTFFNHWVVAFAFSGALSSKDLVWYDWNLTLDPTDGEVDNANLFIVNNVTGRVKWLTPPIPFWFLLLIYVMRPLDIAVALYASLLGNPRKCD